MSHNIHVKRYADPSSPWHCAIEPEDRSWVLFVPRDPTALPPQLWNRVEAADANGAVQHTYAPAV